MAETFNFDSDENVVNIKTPSVTPISKNLFGLKNAAGLWISSDDLNACGWKSVSVGLKPHTISTKNNTEVTGFGILNPRICVLRRTNLLRLDGSGKFLGLWLKGDGDYRDEKGNRLYICIRRYLLLFLDENNEPLHKHPVQLTARGNFQVDFDKNLMSFRKNMERAYADAKMKALGQMSDIWHAMCVFCPVFESRIVGTGNRTSEACMVKNYVIPTEKDWNKLCVGYKETTRLTIIELFNDSLSWIVRNT